MAIFQAIDAILCDLRYAVRALRRTPAFSLTVILTLALGIGANSAVFSALDAVLLRPLPFPDGDRLMQLRQRLDNTSETNIAPVRLEDWQRLNSTFSAITGYYTEDISETSGEFAERIKRANVAPRFVEVWGIEPLIGRGFTLENHRTGGPPGVLVSYRYWRDRLGSDPNVLSRTVRIGTAAVPIVGVMPATFLFPDRSVDVWSPVALDFKFALPRNNTWYLGVGRLRPGVTVEQARANLAAVQTELAQQYGDVDAKIAVTVAPLKEATVGSARRSLWVLFAGVSVLLLIMCSNIAALLLSRAAHRRQELAVRLSLGASPLAVARQTLIEALVLSVTGASLGLLFAAAGIGVLRTATIEMPRLDEIAIDWRLAVYTLASAGLVTVLCGMLPALGAALSRNTLALGDNARTVVSSRYGLQSVLVGAQVALSVTLLVGAALLARSVYELWQIDSGFNLNNVLALRVSGNYAETVNMDRLRARIDTMLERLRAIPGVEAAAITGWSLPGVPSEFENTFQLVEAQGDRARNMVAELRSVSPEYFATMQIPVLAGDLCRRRAAPTGGAAAVDELMVNRRFVEQYLSGRTPAGSHLVSANSRPTRIAGVVADARERGLDREAGPIVYFCESAPNPTPYFLLRTHVDPASVAQPVRLAIKEVDPLRAVYEIGVLEDRVADAFGQNRLRAMLLVFFALTALSLASVGIYGTLSYAVTMRRREVALRLALGAVRGGVLRQFLREGLVIIGVASACGVVMTLAVSRLLSGLLYGVSPNDPVILLAVVALVLVVGTAAAMIPAFRASRLDAMHVLREG
jgi:putative ABC transport system permease protein